MRKARAQEAGMMHMETDTAEEMTMAEQAKESLQEQEKPPEEGSTTTTQRVTKGRQDECQLEVKTLAADNNNNVPPTSEETQMEQVTAAQRQETTAEKTTKQAAADAKTQAEERSKQSQEVEAKQHTTAVTEPSEVSPKEWQKHHDLWLNAVMRAAIGEENHLPIPNLHEYVQVHHPAPDNDIDVALVRDYVTQYDL